MPQHPADSEGYTCAITDAQEVPVSLVAPDYRFIYANPAYHRYYKTPARELKGLHAAEVIGEPLFSETVRPKLDLCLKERRRVVFEQELRNPDGRTRFVSITYSPLEREGELVGVIATYRDRTEELLQQRRMADIAAALPGFIYQFRVDAEGVPSFPYVGPGSRKLFGLEPEDLMRDVRLVLDVVHPDDREKLENAMTGAMAKVSTYQLEHRIVGSDGEIRWIHSESIPQREEDGAIVWTGVALDISRRRRAEEIKQRFLANMSHELRTPLNGILGMLSLLAGGPHLEEQRPYLDLAADSARHLLQIVQDMLDFSRISANTLKLFTTEFDVVDELTRLVDRHRAAAEEKGLTISLVCDQKSCRIRGDRVRVSQILVNLLSNALKYSESGTIEVRLSVDEDLRITVGDQGPGIPLERQAELFEPFHQLEDPYTKEHGGTGIGLAIVKSLATLMGGTVELRSRPGEGTTVEVALPLPDGECAAVEEVEPPARPPGERESGARRILIVEDEAVNRFFLRKLLTTREYTVAEAEDGIEAVAAVRADPPDCVLMDIGLPRMNGIEAIREIRKEARFRGLPILAVTAHTNVEDRERILAAGADDIVIKPYRDFEIFEKMEQVSAGAEKRP